MPVTIELAPELEARLRREAARLGLEPGAYVARAVEQHLSASPPAAGNGSNGGQAAPTQLTSEEAEILQQINLGLPPDFWASYRELLRRRDEESLSAAEQAALVGMSDRVEEANARRMAHLVRLARIRGVELDALMRDLGLPGATRA